jgi:hypothetical protein
MSPVSEALPVIHVSKIEPRPIAERWLIDQLWSASGVGIVGGQARTYKTWLAADLALAVAAGTSALGRFQAKIRGPVLVFAAEDDPPAMRVRFEAVAEARGVRLASTDLFLIDLPELCLNDPRQLERLTTTVQRLKPRLLVLDPFVRLVRGLDENSAHDVSAILGALRGIQRAFDVAVMLIHHMRKSPSSHPGHQLRGSSDFAAWSDSALYLTRQGDERLVTIEHRAAPAPEPIRVRLDTAPAPHLVVCEDNSDKRVAIAAEDPLHAAILRRLSDSPRPQTTSHLRDRLRIRNATLLDALKELAACGLVVRGEQGGWSLPDHAEKT